jgi:hypothetical protein
VAVRSSARARGPRNGGMCATGELCTGGRISRSAAGHRHCHPACPVPASSSAVGGRWCVPVKSFQANESDMLTWVREYFVGEQITGPDPATDLRLAWRDNQDFACVAFKEYQRLETAQERKRWEEHDFPLVTFAADLFFPLLVAEFIEHKEPLPESLRQWLIEGLRQLPHTRRVPLFNPSYSPALLGRRNQWRDYQIGRAVLGVVMRYQMRPTRNRAKRYTANAAESACSIVAKALGTLGINLTENAVEAIWNRLRGGQAVPAVLKSD